jgi:hypothetical protein
VVHALSAGTTPPAALLTARLQKFGGHEHLAVNRQDLGG